MPYVIISDNVNASPHYAQVVHHAIMLLLEWVAVQAASQPNIPAVGATVTST
ncbi:MAG: hypothetical protein H5T63_01715 [Chloroflexi bacterium]|nr:hypothetical protein [Chloroflexota bacterium]